MQCPKCKGKPFTSDLVAGPQGGVKRRLMYCKHCGGHGEIKEGQIWRCEVDSMYPINIYKTPLEYTDKGWKVNGHILDQRNAVTPLCRMKEVE